MNKEYEVSTIVNFESRLLDITNFDLHFSNTYDFIDFGPFSQEDRACFEFCLELMLLKDPSILCDYDKFEDLLSLVLKKNLRSQIVE